MNSTHKYAVQHECVCTRLINKVPASLSFTATSRFLKLFETMFESLHDNVVIWLESFLGHVRTMLGSFGTHVEDMLASFGTIVDHVVIRLEPFSNQFGTMLGPC